MLPAPLVAPTIIPDPVRSCYPPANQRSSTGNTAKPPRHRQDLRAERNTKAE